MVFVGREKQLAELRERRDTKRNEFIAVYGRRRIGKTLLVETAYQGGFYFRHVGISPEWIKKRTLSPLRTQLDAFVASLSIVGWKCKVKPKSWLRRFRNCFCFYKVVVRRQEKSFSSMNFLGWIRRNRAFFPRLSGSST